MDGSLVIEPQTSRSRMPTRVEIKFINLALQGGGAHGAFTWGVLDRLLEDERIAFEGISAASAGAARRLGQRLPERTRAPAAKESSRTWIGSMSSSIHGRTRQATGRIEVPSNENTPCSAIHKVMAEVVVTDWGDQGVQLSANST